MWKCYRIGTLKKIVFVRPTVEEPDSPGAASGIQPSIGWCGAMSRDNHGIPASSALAVAMLFLTAGFPSSGTYQMGGALDPLI